MIFQYIFIINIDLIIFCKQIYIHNLKNNNFKYLKFKYIYFLRIKDNSQNLFKIMKN